MSKPSCFLSCSFRPDDEYVISFFKNLLEDHFEVLTAESEDSTDIYDKIFPKIRASQVCFAIFSRRAKMEGEDWTPPPDVLIETSFALAHRHKIYGFVEAGIQEQQLGILRFSSRNYPRFGRERAALENKRKAFKEYIRAASQELNVEIGKLYDYTHVTKEVTVYRNGYGVIRNRYTVEFSRDLNEFVGKHSLGGGRSGKKGYSLPHLTEMLAHGPQVRKDSGSFVATALVKGSTREEAVSLHEISYSPERIDFEVKILGPFAPLSLLTFEWSWGSPDLFPVSSGGLATGKRNQDLGEVESRFWLPLIRRVANFTFVLRFERPVRLIQEPIFRVFDQGDVLLAEKTGTQDVEIQKSSLYVVYVCRLPAIGVPYGPVIAQWRPE